MNDRIACLEAAAKSPWADAVFVACDPLLIRTNDAFNRALDLCNEAKIGLIAMKTTRGLGRKAAERRGVPEGHAGTEQMPGFDKMGISAFGAVHFGIWSDQRFAAVCSAMLTRPMIDENTANARKFKKPLTDEQWKWLEQGMKKLARATCPGCDGSCQRAAGTNTDFCSIARYLAYYEEDGNREAFQRLYRSLPAERRNWQGGDLDAASHACVASLDFKTIFNRVEDLT
jgi:hypothetical protein